MINRTPSDVLKGKTPFEMLYIKPPPLQHLRVIGCLCYAHNQKHRGDKFDSRSWKCVFVGYPFEKNGCRLYDIESGTVFLFKDVIFLEDKFPYKTRYMEELGTTDLEFDSTPDILDHADEHVHVPPHLVETFDSISPNAEEEEVDVPEQIPTDEPLLDTSSTATDTSTMPPNSSSSDQIDVAPSPPVTDDIDQRENQAHMPMLTPSADMNEPIIEEFLGHGHRQKKKSTRLKDFVANTIHETSCYPLKDFMSCDNFSEHHRQYLTGITSNPIPQHYAQAMEDENFRQAMKYEIVALEANDTWTVEILPQGKKLLNINGCTL